MRSLFIYLNIVSYAFFYISEEGFGITEVLFFGIQGVSFLYLGTTFIKDAIIKSPKLSAGSVFTFSIVLLVFVAALYGLLIGNPVFGVFSEFTYYLPLFLLAAIYLSEPKQEDVNAAVFAMLSAGVIVSINNMINYQQIILQATMVWKVEKARVANGEMLLVFNLIYLFTSDYFKNKGLNWFLIRFGIIGIHLIALVISQSRGYWILCIGSLALFILFSDVKVKFKLFLIGTFTVPFLAVIIFNYYSEMELVFNGILKRIESFTSLSRDTSLLERYIEYEQIKEMLIQNPFTGYGLGSYYNRQYIVVGYSIPKLYIHNAYYSVIYKFGILGFISFVGMHLSIVFRLFDKHFIQKGKALGTALLFMFLLIFGLNLTSPQYYSSEAMLVFVFGSLYTRHGFHTT